MPLDAQQLPSTPAYALPKRYTSQLKQTFDARIANEDPILILIEDADPPIRRAATLKELEQSLLWGLNPFSEQTLQDSLNTIESDLSIEGSLEGLIKDRLIDLVRDCYAYLVKQHMPKTVVAASPKTTTKEIEEKGIFSIDEETARRLLRIQPEQPVLTPHVKYAEAFTKLKDWCDKHTPGVTLKIGELSKPKTTADERESNVVRLPNIIKLASGKLANFKSPTPHDPHALLSYPGLELQSRLYKRNPRDKVEALSELVTLFGQLHDALREATYINTLGGTSKITESVLQDENGRDAILQYSQACSTIVRLFRATNHKHDQESAFKRAFGNTGRKDLPWLRLNTDDFNEQLHGLIRRAVEDNVLQENDKHIWIRSYDAENFVDDTRLQWENAIWTMQTSHSRILHLGLTAKMENLAARNGGGL